MRLSPLPLFIVYGKPGGIYPRHNFVTHMFVFLHLPDTNYSQSTIIFRINISTGVVGCNAGITS